MKKINENAMAKVVAEIEGGEKNQNIAQIKETIKITLDYLADEWKSGNEEAVVSLIKKHMNSDTFSII